MTDRHAELVKHYSDRANIDFIDGVKNIETEKTLHALFGIRSDLTPDLIYEDRKGLVYVGEIKSHFGSCNLMDARRKAERYGRALSGAGIENVPFIIVDFYKEILKKID